MVDDFKESVNLEVKFVMLTIVNPRFRKDYVGNTKIVILKVEFNMLQSKINIPII